MKKHLFVYLLLIIFISSSCSLDARTQANHTMVILDRIDQAIAHDDPAIACSSFQQILDDPTLLDIEPETRLDIIDVIKEYLKLRFGSKVLSTIPQNSPELKKLILQLEPLAAQAHTQAEAAQKTKSLRKKNAPPFVPIPLSPFKKFAHFCKENKGLLVAGGLGALALLAWKKPWQGSNEDENPPPGPGGSSKPTQIIRNPNTSTQPRSSITNLNQNLSRSSSLDVETQTDDNPIDSTQDIKPVKQEEPQIPPLEQAQATAQSYVQTIISRAAHNRNYNSDEIMGEVNQQLKQLSAEDARNDSLVEHVTTLILKNHTQNPVTIVDQNGHEIMVPDNILRHAGYFDQRRHFNSSKRGNSDVDSGYEDEPINSEFLNKKTVRVLSDCLAAYEESAERHSNRPVIGRTARIIDDIITSDLPLSEVFSELVETTEALQLDNETQSRMWPLLARLYVDQHGYSDLFTCVYGQKRVVEVNNEAYHDIDEWPAPKALIQEIRRYHFLKYNRFPDDIEVAVTPRDLIAYWNVDEECREFIAQQEQVPFNPGAPQFEDLCYEIRRHSSYTQKHTIQLVRTILNQITKQVDARQGKFDCSGNRIVGYCNHLRMIVNGSQKTGKSFFLSALENGLGIKFYRENRTLHSREDVDSFFERFENSLCRIAVLPKIQKDLSHYCAQHLQRLCDDNTQKLVIVMDKNFDRGNYKGDLRFKREIFVPTSDIRTFAIIKDNMERVEKGKGLRPGFIDYLRHNLRLRSFRQCDRRGRFHKSCLHCQKRKIIFDLINSLQDKNYAPDTTHELEELINDGSLPINYWQTLFENSNH